LFAGMRCHADSFFTIKIFVPFLIIIIIIIIIIIAERDSVVG
jgi:hypothetical protein